LRCRSCQRDNPVNAASAPDDAVLFELPVTKIWLHQLMLGFTLIGHGSYRGAVELMRDLVGARIRSGEAPITAKYI
jgi:hypothetical protein